MGRTVPAVLLLVTAALPVGLRASPTLSRVMKAPDSEALLIFGEGFAEPELQVLVGLPEVVWFPDTDTDKIAHIRESGAKLPGVEPLPSEPPADAQVCSIIRSDSQVIVAGLPRDAGRAVWMKTAKGLSKPVAFGFAQLWWLSADAVAPGQDVRVFGRHLISCPYRPASYAFLVPKAGGPPVEAPAGLGRNPYYERTVRLPQDLPEGDYDLYLHNGAGGPHGWSNPLPLRVAQPETPPEAVLNVRDFGAVGNGMTDDTESLQKALTAAEAAGGGTVYLPPGKYIAHTHLIPAEHVYLQGAGQELTILTVSERYGFHGTHPRTGPDAGLVVLAHRCGISDMTLENRRPLTQMVFIRREPPYSIGEDIHVRRCTFRGGQIPWEPGKWRSGELPIVIDGPVRRLEITDCRFDGTPGGIAGWGRVWKGVFSRNVFRSQPLQGTDMISIRHLEECCVEDNLVELAHRGLCFQNWKGWGQFYHNCIAGNVVRDIAARRDNASETYLLEGGATHWHGFVSSSTPERVTVENAGWKPDEHRGRIAIITHGRGLGQYRFISGNDGTNLTLAQPWDVPPDATSYLAVGEFFVENLLLDNSDLDGDAAVQYWGSCIGNVLAGHISRNAQGLWFWTYEDRDNYGLCAFNETVNCRLLDRGAIWLTSERADSASAPGALCFGNLFATNQVVDFRERPGNQYWPYWLDPAYDPGKYPAVSLSDKSKGRDPGVCYNLFDGNQLLRGPLGIRMTTGTKGNVFRRTRVDGIGVMVEDKGEGNVVGERSGAP